MASASRRASLFLAGAIDINLIPFSMIDHIDILKDGASAVYGADAVAGVVQLLSDPQIPRPGDRGTYGNTNLGASNDMGEWEAWLKAGTGDDKTDIVVIADFFQRTGAPSTAATVTLPVTGIWVPFGGFDVRSANFPGRD